MPRKASRTRKTAKTTAADKKRSGQAPTPVAAPDAVDGAATSADLRKRLEEAARDLLFLSESESPFEYVELPDAAPAELTPQAVAAALGEPEAPVQTRSLDDWLNGHIEQADPADPVAQENVGRYRALKAALTGSLSGVQVFRVGEPQVRYYALGRMPDGRIAGLMAQALET